MGIYNPISTYRIQFNKSFTFRDAEKIIPYLQLLGVKTIYASPVFEAVRGSNHGYDVTDPTMLNPEIGSAEDHRRLCEKLSAAGIGWIQDIVPNHMAFSPDNPWIFDVLQKGERSRFYSYFDIIPGEGGSGVRTKLMLPFFGKMLDEMLENGELKLSFQEKGVMLGYYDTFYPVSQETYDFLLASGQLTGTAGEKFEKILRSTSASVDERMLHLHDLYSRDQEFQREMDKWLAGISEEKNLLSELIDLQHYEPVHWQETEQRINFRRFFTINGLICLNIHKDFVFEHHHMLIREWLKEGLVQGVRVDHIDGLYDPDGYLKKLREMAGDNAYIVVEKILEEGEVIPVDWPVQGTTGYEFLGLVNNLLTNKDAASHFHRFLEEWTGRRWAFDEVALEKKKFFLEERFNGDLDNLVDRCLHIDFEPLKQVKKAELRGAIAGFLLHCPVYRIYGIPSRFSKEDRRLVEEILYHARDEQSASNEAMDALGQLFLSGLKTVDGADDFFRRCMQFTGPLMAKGIEDTLFYLYNPFLAHNEVGDSPSYFGLQASRFHEEMVYRRLYWPLAMNATSTHDTKRGSDARARLNVLSDMPEKWMENTRRWQEQNLEFKTVKGEKAYPTKNDTYFIYQSLFAHVPMDANVDDEFRERFGEFIIKALREAKINTSWSEPDEDYERLTLAFVKKLLSGDVKFLGELIDFVNETKLFGTINSIVQLILRNTVPGVPDNFQGTEVWNFNFVDPDNRRPVDYGKLSYDLEEMIVFAGNDQSGLVKDLWSSLEDGRIKQWVNHVTLKLRSEYDALFSKGEYVPLAVQGLLSDHIIAFERCYEDQSLVVVLPLNLAGLPWLVDWKDTAVVINREAHQYKDIITGTIHRQSEKMFISDLFQLQQFSVLTFSADPSYHIKI